MPDRSSEGHDLARSAQTLEQAWQVMLERLRSPENDQGVRLWLASPKVRPVGIDAGIFTLECPTALFQLIIRDRYAEQLAVVASEVLGYPITEVRSRVSGAALREHEAHIHGGRSAAERDEVRSGDRPGDQSVDKPGDRHVPRGGRWGHGNRIAGTERLLGRT